MYRFARKIAVNVDFFNLILNIFISFYKHTCTTWNIIQYNRIRTKAIMLMWFLSSNFEINYINNDG